MSCLTISFDWLPYTKKDSSWGVPGHRRSESVTGCLERTTGYMTIRAGDFSLTRNENTLTGEISDSVLVSAWPLAKFLARNWWRLNYEQMAEGSRPSLSWRMAHEIPSIGYGFIWPSITISPLEDDCIRISSRPTEGKYSHIRYISQPLEIDVPILKFQRSIETFINEVLMILEDKGLDRSLESIWRELVLPYRGNSLNNVKKIEALLGYDTGECPISMLADFTYLEMTIGFDALSKSIPVYLKHLDKIKENADLY